MSVLSPILAEIVMEDLQNKVFEKIYFNLDFYARYVNYYALCIHTNNGDTLLNAFNSIQDYNLLLKLKLKRD